MLAPGRAVAPTELPALTGLPPASTLFPMALSRAPLGELELADRLAGPLAGWEARQRSGGGWCIERQFRFPSFREAFAFMTALALAAERLDHHPEWSNVYNRVDVLLATHDANGVTEYDLALAEAAESLAGRLA